MNPDVLSAVFAGATVILAAGAVYAAWVLRVAKGVNAAAAVAALKVESAAEAAAFKVDLDAVKKELAEFKVHVAATYASSSTIEQMENRLVDAINRLGDRLDRVLERRPTRG